MNPKFETVAYLVNEGRTHEQIARQMGTDVLWVKDVLDKAEVKEMIKLGVVVEEVPRLYSKDEITLRVESLIPKALDVVEIALQNPKAVSQVQWGACQYILNKAAAIQEMTKDAEGMKIVNQFVMNDRAAGALEKLLGEMGATEWDAAFADSLNELPPGVQ